TPHTELLIRELMPRYRVAVLSRGYGRKSRGFRIVGENDNVKDVGDEPLQMKRKFRDITVAVSASRTRGVAKLLTLPSNERPGVILLDDAFQHRWISPSQNILLIEYSSIDKSEVLFPLGRLRDLPSQIKRADIVIVTKCPLELNPEEQFRWEQKLSLMPNQKLFFSAIRYMEPQSLYPEADRRYIYSRYAIILTAVANPTLFHYHILNNYKIVRKISFRDHHNFNALDVCRINRLAVKWPKAVIFTTEKDAQRIVQNRRISMQVKERLFFIPIEAEIINEASSFIQAISK
ncbi:MAG: tetraacyldisaccharide 4'-kinase, partial [Bacteroidales bacterium]|nr:tetraacyldisaccharide 4'-kinase [Bacteroidales bacterium]